MTHAYPSVYKYLYTRLQTDGGEKVNCFNLDCGGFRVKENSPFALAAAWSDFDSQVGGERRAVTVSIHRVSLHCIYQYISKTPSNVITTLNWMIRVRHYVRVYIHQYVGL